MRVFARARHAGVFGVTTSGTGVFFDGLTSRRQDVHVVLDVSVVLDMSVGQDGALAILKADGSRLDAWPLAALREEPSPAGMLRLSRAGGVELARLEIRDESLAEAIRAAAPKLKASARAEAGMARKVVAWSVAAVVSLSLFALYGVPALADRLVPMLPWSVDQRMGRAADSQIRTIFSSGDGDFACGTGSQEKPGREALDRLAKKLSDAAKLPGPIEIIAVRNDFVNALALPGGVIYLFDGLIQRAEGVDELAGVLAHEIGHAAHRDGARRALQAGGASLLFGFVFGDFVGGTATVAIVRTLVDASYSRKAETDADVYAVQMMKGLGGDPRAMGRLLVRLTRSADEDDGEKGDRTGDKTGEKPGEDRHPSITEWIASHPETQGRARAMGELAGVGPTRPLLDDADFLAIKRICGPAA